MTPSPPSGRRRPPARPPTTDSGDAIFHALIAHASDAIIVQDMESGRVVDLNDRAVALYGYTREEMLAFPPGWDLRAEEQARDGDSLFHLAAMGSDVPASPRWHRRKDGTAVPVEASVFRLHRDGRVLLIATLRDVSRRITEQLERDMRLAEVEG